MGTVIVYMVLFAFVLSVGYGIGFMNATAQVKPRAVSYSLTAGLILKGYKGQELLSAVKGLYNQGGLIAEGVMDAMVDAHTKHNIDLQLDYKNELTASTNVEMM